MADPAARTILVVDDEPAVRELFVEVLNASGYRLLEAGSGEQALAVLAREPVDLVITDLVMPGFAGADLIRAIRKQYRGIRIIAMTGAGGEQFETLRLLGANACLVKPCSPAELEAAVQRLLTSDS